MNYPVLKQLTIGLSTLLLGFILVLGAIVPIANAATNPISKNPLQTEALESPVSPESDIEVSSEIGPRIFQLQCAGCHAGGGNLIRRGKTLKKRALERNGFDRIEAIAGIVTHGKNNMSAYQDRLSPEEIQQVSAYVFSQAQQGWSRD
ncbi:MAG: c-type cytochrome [Oscillatoriales cyanobacterium RM1_1_9]|nr:c-type cytochrome [Oscillatoriales cyanobacterium SM2_3_0]NJO45550.1 c-type cytochrome [Oscillatoriales cyanobacterium RM2_1_1]NJO71230.1 c-type cytochrome [Oscillatoriales cyanobacterium RM1_1_9]